MDIIQNLDLHINFPQTVATLIDRLKSLPFNEAGAVCMQSSSSSLDIDMSSSMLENGPKYDEQAETHNFENY